MIEALIMLYGADIEEFDQYFAGLVAGLFGPVLVSPKYMGDVLAGN